MPYELPEWIDLEPALLRVESGLVPDQLQATADEAAMETVIATHINTSTARVLGEARVALGILSFPSTDAELQKAFPVEVEFPVLHLHDASECTKDYARQIIVADAYQLWAPAYVNFSFPFQIGDPDSEEHGQVAPSQEIIEAAMTAAAASRANRIEEQKQIAMQAISSLVFAKLWYTVLNPGDEYKAIADGHWKTGMSLISTLKNKLSPIRAAYQLRTCPFV